METAIDIPALAGASGASAVDVTRPQQEIPLVDALRQACAESGASILGLVKEFAGLAFGPGRLAFSEYLALRLFDTGRLAGADKKAFVGLDASRKLWLRANFRLEYFGLLDNKIAANALFTAYGFRTTPTLAVFSSEIGLHGPGLIRTTAELRKFLAQPEIYPLFGKPLSGLQSLGSASFDRYDAERDCLIGIGGRQIPLDKFVADVGAHYGAGYLLQSRVSPHPAVRAMCGDRLATVRLLTIMSAGTPKLIRACWKIPAGDNGADNYWRPGNLLAQLDLESGRVLRVVRGTGLHLEELSHHPDTSAALVGSIVPNWREVTETALEGAKLVPEVRLIGWDVAPVDGGAVLVELNQTPDFLLPQLADRRGMLDETFKAFLAECKRDAAKWEREKKDSARSQALSGFKID